MDIDTPAYSDWFLPKNIPGEILLPERTQMAAKTTKSADPDQPKCQDSDELVDVEPDYAADETPESTDPGSEVSK
jgi:hypothetical protein